MIMKRLHRPAAAQTLPHILTMLIAFSGVGWAGEEQHPVLLESSSVTLSGYVDTSIIWNFGSGNHTVGRAFDGDTRQDGFNLNVVKVQLDKPAEEESWSSGYRVGLLFGPDANALATTSTGLANATSDFAVKNAYVSLRAPLGAGVDFKAGVFDTLIGYEVPEAGNNVNYSRSFGFYLEPAIHTGLMASYRLCDALSVAGCIADPANVVVGPNVVNSRTEVAALFSYLGAFTLTAPEKAGFLRGATLTGAVMDHGMESQPDVIQFFIGGTAPTPISNLSLGLAYDYRGSSKGNGRSSHHASTVAGYLIHKVNQKLTLSARTEYATGSNSTWYDAVAGRKNELLGLTATLDYRFWANVISRIEFRWDRDLSGTGIFNDPASPDLDATSLALNVIYTF